LFHADYERVFVFNRRHDIDWTLSSGLTRMLTSQCGSVPENANT